jgi:ribosomal subunit interface protein
MPLRITGKNVDIGQALREHITTRTAEELGKYYDEPFTGHVVVQKEGKAYIVDCSIQLASGTTLQSRGEDFEVYPAAEKAVERIGKRMRRHKRKLKNFKGGESAAGDQTPGGKAWGDIEAQATVFAAFEDEEIAEDFAPTVVAETTQKIRTMSVGTAVSELDFTGAPVVMFRNAGNGGVNVVYRRNDGNIGWIDPSLSEITG